jgi:hypothetical protein
MSSTSMIPGRFAVEYELSQHDSWPFRHKNLNFTADLPEYDNIPDSIGANTGFFAAKP